MSTFSGYVSEFPDIRIDYFRTLPGKRPPLACFLSHVHSDHLVGLDSFKSPFIYCSPATREILLKLEKRSHQLNFSKGILEVRRQTYKDLRNIIKTIPLETPTRIELAPGNEIQVTLFDSNHCIGAVAFLIEGQGRSIIYSGDVRAERWWTDSFSRHPVVIPYTLRPGLLDRLYLDTTFAVMSAKWRSFPTKQEGLQELLKKVQTYPEHTRFHFHAWTFGYEDVWLALSNVLQTPIHVDEYRHGLYTSLSNTRERGNEARETPIFCGYRCGNFVQPGIFTRDAKARLHSCVPGAGCNVFDPEAEDVVWISPIIARHNGVELPEEGAQSRKGDLKLAHELVIPDQRSAQALMDLCESSINDDQTLDDIRELLATHTEGVIREGFRFGVETGLTLSEHELGQKLPISRVTEILAGLNISTRTALGPAAEESQKDLRYLSASSEQLVDLPASITFPYSRHSSYEELCGFVEALKPRDIWPCVEVPIDEWEESISIEALFGQYCVTDGQLFSHDEQMRGMCFGIDSDVEDDRQPPECDSKTSQPEPVYPYSKVLAIASESKDHERNVMASIGWDPTVASVSREAAKQSCDVIDLTISNSPSPVLPVAMIATPNKRSRADGKYDGTSTPGKRLRSGEGTCRSVLDTQCQITPKTHLVNADGLTRAALEDRSARGTRVASGEITAGLIEFDDEL